MTDELAADRSTGRSAPVRQLVHEGVRWQVFERRVGDYDRRGAYRLVFESDIAVRTVRNFPTEWYDLPADELMALSWGA